MNPSSRRHRYPNFDPLGRFILWVLLASTVFLSGCATAQLKSSGGAAADLLPSPGALVEVGTLTVPAGKPYDFDLALEFRNSLVDALKEEQMLWSGDKATPRFRFDATIVDYEPGSAFKRWVLPGWGSTVLEVRGEMRVPDSGAVAAVIKNKRSVSAGGLYTIGAWKSIIDNVTDDLAREIKMRINGGGFMIVLAPYAEQSAVVAQTRNPLEIEVKKITDLRTDKLHLGERTAAFSTKMGDIYPDRRVADYLTETLADALRSMGHKAGPAARGVTVDGELQTFRVETPATMLYWDVTAEIVLKLQMSVAGKGTAITRTYTAKKSERTYVWPSAALIEKAVGASVADLVHQIQADNVWNTLAAE